MDMDDGVGIDHGGSGQGKATRQNWETCNRTKIKKIRAETKENKVQNLGTCMSEKKMWKIIFSKYVTNNVSHQIICHLS